MLKILFFFLASDLDTKKDITEAKNLFSVYLFIATTGDSTNIKTNTQNEGQQFQR